MAEVIIDVNARDNASGTLNGVSGALNGLADIAQTVAAAALAVLAAAVTGVTLALKDSIAEASEAEQAYAKLEAIYNATGGAVGLSTEQLKALATEIQAVTRFSDEDVMAAEARLLMYENINQNIYPEAIKLTADLAEVLGVDMSSAARMIGMALDDPTQGIGRLNTQFRLFNDTELENIITMAEHGQVAEAQAIIMDRLREKVGGAAEAMGDTFAGKLEILKNLFSDLQELIGGPFIVAFSTFLDKIIEFLKTSPEIQKFNEFFGTLNKLLEQGAPLFSAIAISLDNLGMKFPELETKIQPLVDVFIAMQRVLDEGGTKLQVFQAGLQTLFTETGIDEWAANIGTALSNAVQTLIGGEGLFLVGTALATALAGAFSYVLTELLSVGIGTAFATMPLQSIALVIGAFAGQLVLYFLPVSAAIMAVVGAIDLIRTGDMDTLLAPLGPIFEKIKTTLADLLPFLAEVGLELKDKFMVAARALASDVIPFLVEQLGKFATWFQENLPLIKDFVQTIADFFTQHVLPAILDFWTVVKPILGGIIDLFLNLVTLLMQIVTGDWAGAWETVKKAIVGIFQSIYDAVFAFFSNTDLGRWIIDALFNAIMWAKDNIGDPLREFGAAIIKGLEAGIDLATFGLYSKWKELVDKIVGWFKNLLGISSPSTVFRDLGKDIVQGLIDGIDSMVDWAITTIKNLAMRILEPFKPILDLLGIDTTRLFGGTTTTGGASATTTFGSNLGGTTGTLTGSSVVNNFYGPVYFGDLGQLGYDCPSPHPLLAATAGGLVGVR